MQSEGSRKPRAAPAWRGLPWLGGFLPIAALFLGASGHSLSAQGQDIDWSQEARVLGVNSILGGVSGAVAALTRGDPPLEAFARGLLGGSLVYGGKRLVVGPSWGVKVLGRQLGSVGGSIIGNEVAGRGSLDQIALAFGPVRAYVGHEHEGVDWRLDALATGALLWGFAQGAKPDFQKTLSSGAVVFAEAEADLALPGTIYHTKPIESSADYLMAHEPVHVLQYDQSFLSWGEPLEGRFAERYPGFARIHEHLDFNVPVLMIAAVLGIWVWEYPHNVWEYEADYLSRTQW